MSKKIVARYIGSGFVTGIPAKNLTEADWQNLTEQQQWVVKGSPLYEMVPDKKATKSKKEGD